MSAMLQVKVPEEEQNEAADRKWTLKELKPWHMNLCSMLAQGIPRSTIAAVMDCAPEYVSSLAQQPLIQQYIRDMCAYAGLQLESQFVKVVEVIGDTLENGGYKEKMQAARLQMEATKRIGSKAGEGTDKPNSEDKLLNLADRLVGLLEGKKMATDIPIEATVYDDQNIPDADFSNRAEATGSTDERQHPAAQDAGDGMPDSEWIEREGGQVEEGQVG